MKNFSKIGGISGLESLIRNVAYILMVSRMVNVVNEAGTFWVANNFVWGWLLLPITQLGELIKKEVSTEFNSIKNNSMGYFIATILFCIFWSILIPAYKPFMKNVLNYNEVDKLYELVMLLYVFFIFYSIQNVCDSTFYGNGKTNYMLFESAVTNIVYYGIAFILYKTNVWKPSLKGIAVLFDLGNVFDTIVTFGVYAYFLCKNKINILNIEGNDNNPKNNNNVCNSNDNNSKVENIIPFNSGRESGNCLEGESKGDGNNKGESN